MTKPMPFFCSICEEESTRICASCTKDTCGNHLCDKCGCCSDCCGCDVALLPDEPEPVAFVRQQASAVPHPHPMPDPDPAPEPEPIPTYPPRDL
jgi:hypothetical protein